MKALVVYESMFGNTRRVAEEIARGIGDAAEVVLCDVDEAPAAPDPDLDLLVVGGPTHAFSMSRRSTREDARDRGPHVEGGETGIREWLGGLPRGRHTGTVAAFDTRVEKVRRLPGSAAKAAARVLRRSGYAEAAAPESFYVLDIDGPLAPGELARAHGFGARLGAAARSRVDRSASP